MGGRGWAGLGFEKASKRERRKSEREKGSVETEKKEQIPFNEKTGGLERQKRSNKCKACDKKALKTQVNCVEIYKIILYTVEPRRGKHR